MVYECVFGRVCIVKKSFVRLRDTLKVRWGSFHIVIKPDEFCLYESELTINSGTGSA